MLLAGERLAVWLICCFPLSASFLRPAFMVSGVAWSLLRIAFLHEGPHFVFGEPCFAQVGFETTIALSGLHREQADEDRNDDANDLFERIVGDEPFEQGCEVDDDASCADDGKKGHDHAALRYFSFEFGGAPQELSFALGFRAAHLCLPLCEVRACVLTNVLQWVTESSYAKL